MALGFLSAKRMEALGQGSAGSFPDIVRSRRLVALVNCQDTL